MLFKIRNLADVFIKFFEDKLYKLNNSPIVFKVLTSIILWAFFLIPLWISMILWYIVSPEQTIEKLILVIAFLFFFGILQFWMIVVVVYLTIQLLFDRF